MTELQPYEPQAVVSIQDAAVHRLGEWARSAQAAHQVAQSLVKTSFVPAQFRDKAGEATAAILAGLEVGLQPLASLRAFDVIQGQAAPRAITLRAVVQSYGHEMVLIESTDTRCRMKGRRKGSQEWQTVQWTIDRAKALGLTGKDNWKKQPGAMLVARATSELARLIASDAILGIGYSAEEITDGGNPDDATVVPISSGTRRMSRAKAEPVADELPADEPTDPVGITEPQMKRLQAHYSAHDRDDRLAEASSVLGRDVSSFSDLSKDEARHLIDWIDGPAADPA